MLKTHNAPAGQRLGYFHNQWQRDLKFSRVMILFLPPHFSWSYLLPWRPSNSENDKRLPELSLRTLGFRLLPWVTAALMVPKCYDEIVSAVIPASVMTWCEVFWIGHNLVWHGIALTLRACQDMKPQSLISQWKRNTCIGGRTPCTQWSHQHTQ